MRISLHRSALLAWAIANSEAYKAKSSRIAPIHLFTATLRILDRLYDQDAKNAGIRIEHVDSIDEISAQCKQFLGLKDDQITSLRRYLRAEYLVDDRRSPSGILHRSIETKDIFQQATMRVDLDVEESLTLYHLLLSSIYKPSEEILQGFRYLSLEIPEPPPVDDFGEPGDEEGVPSSRQDKQKSSTPVIDRLGRDLTALARGGRLPSIVGREDEMTSVARHLIRTSKRNVLLLGMAGTGKTAIVEGLAQRLISEDAPEELACFRIVEISISSILAGTRYRGDMEKRLSRIINEAKDNPEIVLFLDEIHLAVGAGTGGEGADIASILLPALSREDFRCIGATTFDEFEQHIKSERAFSRRFQIVRVEEPSIDDAIEICRQWATRIEKVQNVKFDEAAIIAAVELSNALIVSKVLPDKAIDLLENAATYVKLSTLSFSDRAPQKGPEYIEETDIHRVLEEQYGIKTTRRESIDVAVVGGALVKELVGQDRAAQSIETALRSLSEGKQNRMRPLGVFLFVGPTGVGKTYSAEIIARNLSIEADKQSLGRFNMNEYKERHDLSRLIGAPPGFIGHDDYGALFRFVQENPQGVILLDEIEKAHPEILDYFLQIFDKGEGRDSRGRRVDFSRQLFVMTSNIDVSHEHRKLGFQIERDEGANQKDTVRGDLEKVFRKEFLARIDQVTYFDVLALGDYEELFDRRVRDLSLELSADYHVGLEVENEVKNKVCEDAMYREEGARGFTRSFDTNLVIPLKNFPDKRPDTKLILSWDGEVKITTSQL